MITPSSSEPPTAKAKFNNGKKTAAHTPASPAFIKLLFTSQHEKSSNRIASDCGLQREFVQRDDDRRCACLWSCWRRFPRRHRGGDCSRSCGVSPGRLYGLRNSNRKSR